VASPYDAGATLLVLALDRSRCGVKDVTRPVTFADDEARLTTVADTDAIYYIAAFVKDHAVVTVILGFALFYLLLRVTRQR